MIMHGREFPTLTLRKSLIDSIAYTSHNTAQRNHLLYYCISIGEYVSEMDSGAERVVKSKKFIVKILSLELFSDRPSEGEG